MRTQKNKTAFTLIELLVVVAIIAMLVGVVSVGLKHTKRIAINLRQKAVYNALTVGLELYRKDFRDYPPSTDRNGGGGAQVCGAQHLAEAMMGRDEQGFEPATGWYPPDDRLYQTDPRYDPAFWATFYDYSSPASKNRRKSPYVELKHAEILTINDIWEGSNGTSPIYDSQGWTSYRQRSPVIADVFTRHRVQVPAPGTGTRTVGLPILYFRANPAPELRFRLDSTMQLAPDPTYQQCDKYTYDFFDNSAIANLPVIDPPDQNSQHYYDENNPAFTKQRIFYEQITQKQTTGGAGQNFYKPYNENTFLLISAGWDGVYGTRDDITNFDY